ncbi:ATP cone domain-containing protein [Dactylosporangium sp. NPDC051541]|uniref:ATP cone domain-containing protein n=1 Tax=Dactylosporangium sp. NPDC051541 TaxID=3363977 RepID=UPI0037A7C1E5
MQCPSCGSERTRVKDSRPCGGETVRKRVCEGCGQRFSTAERITAEYLQVRKRDGRTEPFSRAKIRQSIIKAAAGVDLPPADVNAFVDRVVQVLNPDAPDLPVPSRDIGRLVLQQLHGGDARIEVIRVRYAMVFMGGVRGTDGGFQRLSDFLEWLGAEYGPARRLQPESTPWAVTKRGGRVEPFQAAKLSRSIGIAAEGRGSEERIRSIALHTTTQVQEALRGQALVTSQQIAAESLKALRGLDPLAYLRYASAVKQYRSIDDFWLDAWGVMFADER